MKQLLGVLKNRIDKLRIAPIYKKADTASDAVVAALGMFEVLVEKIEFLDKRIAHLEGRGLQEFRDQCAQLNSTTSEVKSD